MKQIKQLAQSTASILVVPPVFMTVPGLLVVNLLDLSYWPLLVFLMAVGLFTLGYGLQKLYRSLMARSKTSLDKRLAFFQAGIIIVYALLAVWLLLTTYEGMIFAYVIGLASVLLAGTLMVDKTNSVAV